MSHLRIRNGPNKGAIITLSEEPVTMGRDTSCTVQILDKGASRHHAEVVQVGEMFFVRDTGSRNGTTLNGKRIDGEDLLRPGDTVQIGSTLIAFEENKDCEGNLTAAIMFDNVDDSEVDGLFSLDIDDLGGMDDDEDRDAQNFRILYNFTKILGSETDEESMLTQALEFIQECVPADNIYIFVKEDNREGLIPRARFERVPDDAPRVSRGIILRCLKDVCAVMTNDASSDDRFRDQQSIIISPTHAVMCVPLLACNDVVGVIYTSNSDITRVFSPEDLELIAAIASGLGLAISNVRSLNVAEKMFDSTVRALVKTSEMVNPDTVGHAERVSAYSSGIAMSLKLGGVKRKSIALAAMLHDVGRVVPEETALKYLGDELEMPDKGGADAVHVMVSKRMLETMEGLPSDVCDAILGHHEQWDGSGYPQGLKGDDISLTAQIIAVADYFDHIIFTSEQLEDENETDAAFDKMNMLSGFMFSPKVVTALKNSFDEGVMLAKISTLEEAKLDEIQEGCEAEDFE